MSSRLSDRLSAARRSNFVGRSAEQMHFAAAMEQETLPFNVLHVYGPGGVGKTTLLNQFADQCALAAVAAAAVDARNVEPSPLAFSAALALALGLEASASPLDHLAGQTGRTVVLVDTYENLSALDDWLRSDFLINLPENALIVLAGRYPPAPAWRTDPGWQHLVQVLPLRNLAPEESRDFTGSMTGISYRMDPSAYAEVIAGLYTGISNFNHEMQEIRVEGARVHTRVLTTGLHTGNLMGVPATGNRIALPVQATFTLADNKIVYVQIEFDGAVLLEQMGIIPVSQPVYA